MGEGSASRPGRSLSLGKDPAPIVQEAGWTPGPVWTGAENLAPTGIRSPDRPARSQSLYRLSYPAHVSVYGLANEVEVKPAQAGFKETIVVQSFMTRRTNQDDVEMKFSVLDTAGFLWVDKTGINELNGGNERVRTVIPLPTLTI